jgi:hypothetical protein
MASIRTFGAVLAEMGINPLRLGKAIWGIPIYIRNVLSVYRQNKEGWKINIFPVFADRYEQSGKMTRHYFHMDLWAARIVYQLQFKKIVDIGSRLDGFVAHVLVFCDVEIIDLRPLVFNVKGMSFRQSDMARMDDALEGCTDCVTCLHALEHFGLGRYGDDVDLNSWRVGFRNMARLLKPSGSLILAVPIGRERIEFDAHRVFDPDRIVDEATQLGLAMDSFSFVDDVGDFHDSTNTTEAKGLEYGCGCFHFICR